MAGNIKFSPEEGREMANTITQKRGAIEGEIEDLSSLILNDLYAVNIKNAQLKA